MTKVTQAEFARLKNVSRKTVTRWKKEGRLVMIGERVDVEASQEKLLSSASHRSLGKRRDVTLAPSRPTQVTSNDAGNSTERRPPGIGAPTLAVTLATQASCVGLGAAEGVLRHLANEALARHVADYVTERVRDGAVAMLMDELGAPRAYSSWAAHPLFLDPPEHTRAPEWEDMARDAADWRAQHA